MTRNPWARLRIGDCVRNAIYALQLMVVRRKRDRQRSHEVRAGKRFTFGDFEIICEPAQSRLLVKRVAEALGVIHQVRPALFARMRRDMKRYYIRRGAGAQYWSRLGICVLERDHVAREPVHEVALKIVHEAAHARLLNAGVPWIPSLFERVERRCVKEELSFCKRLAEHGYSVSGRVQWYEKRLERPVYTRKAVRVWQLRDEEARHHARVP